MSGVYATLNTTTNAINLEVARADVWDVRLRGRPHFTNKMYLDTPRLGVGTFSITPADGSGVVGGTARMHLRRGLFSINVSTYFR